MFDKVIYWCGFRYELKKVRGKVATYTPNDENIKNNAELGFTKESFQRFVEIGYIERSER